MPDTIHEFYNNGNLGYNDLKGTGVTIASTTSSQKAAIKDVNITNPSSRELSVKIGSHTLATSKKTEALSGTELLKESQSITINANDSVTWTGLGMSYESGTNFRELTWDSDYFFLLPSSTKNTKSSDGWVTDSTFRSNGSALQNLSELDGMCNVFNAHSMFGRDLGDYYYMRDFQRAVGNNHVDSNKLYYYDASADSSTLVVSGNASNNRRNWEGAWSNRYLVRWGGMSGSGSTVDRFDVFDTTTNSLSKDNVEIIRGYDSNTTTEDRMENMSYDHRMTSIMDNYALIKGHVNFGVGRAFHLLDLDTRRYRTFYGGDANDSWNQKFQSNTSSYNQYHNTSQICKGEDSVYYVINTYTRGNSNSEGGSTSGFQVFSLGTDPATTYLAHGTGNFTVQPTFRYHYFDSNNWDKFRLTESNNGSKQGYMSGFMPMKRIGPTDAKCRYWMFMGSQKCWLIDIQATSSAGITEINFDQGSNTGHGYPWQGQSALNDYVPNCWPIYDESAASTGWGTVGVRTTGILST